MVKYVIFTKDELNTMIEGKAIVHQDYDNNLEIHYLTEESYENMIENFGTTGVLKDLL